MVERAGMTTNPNRVTMYLTPAERATMQRLAERLTRNGIAGLLDIDGKVIIKALVRYLVTTASEEA